MLYYVLLGVLFHEHVGQDDKGKDDKGLSQAEGMHLIGGIGSDSCEEEGAHGKSGSVPEVDIAQGPAWKTFVGQSARHIANQ